MGQGRLSVAWAKTSTVNRDWPGGNRWAIELSHPYLLPLLLRRVGFDPATSSAPFVATLVDVTGLVIYFTVASVVLRGTML